MKPFWAKYEIKGEENKSPERRRNMKRRDLLKMLLPLLLFAILFYPYHILNQNFLVDWLGCGCPQVNELGQTVYPAFDTNDFTRLFWTAVALAATVLAAILSKTIPFPKRWHRAAYVLGIFATGILIALYFIKMMMWN